MILMLDNFDSFTYNLVQMLAWLGEKLEVRRNNVPLEELIALRPDRLVISPGPGRPPDDTGVVCEAIRYFAGKIPILGVCLGHQAIGHVFGAKIVSAKRIMHGKASNIRHHGGLLTGVPSDFRAGRYHSLVIERPLPDCLKIIAESDDGEVMGVQHQEFTNVYGIQFHPESILTASNPLHVENGEGQQILKNFLAL